jgi:hypothetical protein
MNKLLKMDNCNELPSLKLPYKLVKKLEDENLTKCHHATPCPSMVVATMMQKSLHNNKNGEKLNLNKPQIATQHTRICIPM